MLISHLCHFSLQQAFTYMSLSCLRALSPALPLGPFLQSLAIRAQNLISLVTIQFRLISEAGELHSSQMERKGDSLCTADDMRYEEKEKFK